MIKSFEVIRPVDFPYRLISFTFFFNSVNTHIMNMHHAAGMDLIYEQKKMCYVFPQNEFYELLKLQNVQQPHDSKYNWILLKGIFGGDPVFDVELNIENAEEMLELLYPVHSLRRDHISLYRLPEPENDIVVVEGETKRSFHHFQCSKVSMTEEDQKPIVHVVYLSSYDRLYSIINLWFNEENKQMMLTNNKAG